MVKGNLLLESETFRVSGKELLSFADRLDALILAIDRCRANGDAIFGTGDLLFTEFLGSQLYEFCDPQSLPRLETQIPGFRNDLHLFLTYDLLKYDSQTLGTCTSLADLVTLFPAANNGLLGTESDCFECEPKFAVYNENSWHEWKVGFLSRYPEHIVWENGHDYLPNLQYSNQLLRRESRKRFGSSHEDFYKFAGTKAGNEKSALAIEVGKIIAESNFFQYDEAVSKLNQNRGQLRNIYHLKKQNRSLYLSIDVEKASFEVCDYTGHHLGEYLFDGRKQQGPSGGHNITI